MKSMETSLFVVIALVSYSMFEIFSSQAGGKIDANLSSSIFNGLGIVIPLGSYVIYNILKRQETLPSTPKGIIFSVIAGIAIAIFSIVFVKIFEKGGNVSFVIPLIYGGSIVLTSIISRVWLNEKISLGNIVGLVLISLGFLIIVVSKTSIVAK